MYSTLAALLRLRSLPRRPDLDDRATVLTLFARFTDELGSGLLVVLMPSLRARLDLTVQQVGWCFQALYSAGALVESFAALAVDVVRRRPLLVAGAAGWAAALLLAAGADSFGWLLVAFTVAGAAYGPLANTADVVLIEGHPEAVERVSGRSGVIDTVGASLAPAAVALAAWTDVDVRALLLAAGLAITGYAVALARATFPPPRPDSDADAVAPGLVLSRVWNNAREVLGDRTARRWIGALLLVEVLELHELFEPVWLRDVVGASQAEIAVYVAAGLGASLLGLVVLDRWLARHAAWPVLVASTVGAIIVSPALLLAPGYGAKLALVVVLEAVTAPLWPILHARALAAVPGRAGAMTAVVALVGLLPLQAVFGWAAGAVGLTNALLAVLLGATSLLLVVLRGLALPEPLPDADRAGP